MSGMTIVQDYDQLNQLTRFSEIRSTFQKNSFYALVVSVLVHCGIVGSYYGARYLSADDENAPTVRVRIVKYSELGPPPSMTHGIAPPQIHVGTSVKPSIGVPVPVPDAEINPEQTIATQQELSSETAPLPEGEKGEGGRFEIADDITLEEPGIDEFVPVEKIPQIVRSAEPIYPEIARRAGIEGIVWVKILVGKDGKPKRAAVIKEEAGGIFNDAAVSAAMQYLFTPGMMTKGPVPVWVAIKFKFRLTGPS